MAGSHRPVNHHTHYHHLLHSASSALIPLLSSQTDQIHFAQIVTNIVVRELTTIVVFIRLHLPNCTEYFTPSIEMRTFCVLDIFQHSGSGHAGIAYQN